MKPLLLVFFVLAEALNLNCEVLDEYHQSNLFFTKQLYKGQLVYYQGNFMLSPASIQALFAQAAFTVQGKTEDDLLRVAQLPINPSKVGEMYKKINEKLLYNKSESISTSTIYKNFLINPNQKTIVEHKFRTRFNSSYPEGYFHEKHFADSHFEFVNGMFFRHQFKFHERWKTVFHIAPMDDFHMIDGTRTSIYMISASEILNYHYDKLLNVEFLEIPIIDNELTLTIVLPKDLDHLLHVEESLFYCLCSPPYQELNISVTIPNDFGRGYLDIFDTLSVADYISSYTKDARFAINNSYLKLLDGISTAQLDLSLAVENGELYPQLGMRPEDISVKPQEKNIMVNRPFFYYIKHSVMGVVLIGRFIKPNVAS